MNQTDKKEGGFKESKKGIACARARVSYLDMAFSLSPPLSLILSSSFDGALSLNAGVFASILLGSRLQPDSNTTRQSSSSSSVTDEFLASPHVHCFAFILWSFILFAGMTVAGYWIRVRRHNERQQQENVDYLAASCAPDCSHLFVPIPSPPFSSPFLQRWSLRLHVSLTLLLVASCSVTLVILPLPVILLPLFLLTCIVVNLVGPAALMWSQRYKKSGARTHIHTYFIRVWKEKKQDVESCDRLVVLLTLSLSFSLSSPVPSTAPGTMTTRMRWRVTIFDALRHRAALFCTSAQSVHPTAASRTSFQVCMGNRQQGSHVQGSDLPYFELDGADGLVVYTTRIRLIRIRLLIKIEFKP